MSEETSFRLHPERGILAKRWRAGTLVLNESVVGTVQKGGGRWFAYGCMADWEDTSLGSHASEADARRAVEAWVDEKLADE